MSTARIPPFVVRSDPAAELTELQRAQLRAAASYHALVHPGAEILLLVSAGDPDQMPVFTGSATEQDRGEPVLAELRIRSTALGGSSSPAGDGAAAPIRRWIRLGHAEATPATTRSRARQSLPRRVYGVLERRTPLLVDAIRETVMTRRARRSWQPLPRYPEGPHDAPLAEAFAAAIREAPLAEPVDGTEAPSTGSGAEAPPAILFGLHWLQPSGAERWAIESIRIAKQQGYLPVIVTDHDSVHPWLTRPEVEGCVVIAMSEDGSGSGSPDRAPDTAILRAVLSNYRLRGAMLHHSTWLYRVLPLLAEWRPALPVVDSLHTVEYLGGGYPGYAVRFDAQIETHHTISPELSRWLSEVQGVDPAKLVMAPLTELTVDAEHEFRRREPGEPFTLSFVGRLSRDKRPDAFLALVRHLVRRGVPVRAILHGDGELADLVEGMLDRYRLRGVVERRLEDRSVADTLAESHLLVTTSMLEGLPLTTFEAVSDGVPVLSVDLGSQRTIVQDELLLPRPIRRFVRAAEAQVARLAASESAREAAWAEQRRRLTALMRERSAHRFTKELFEQWQQ